MEKSHFTELLNQRKSIRKFKRILTEREKLTSCVKAAGLAPSACNSQPWKFIVIDDNDLKDKFCKKAFSGIYSPSAFAASAGAVVVLLSEKGNIISRLGGMIRKTSFYLIDIGIACAHFVLKAQELGLGTCIIGWFDRKAVLNFLKISAKYNPELIIAIGYADENPEPRSRKEFNQICSFNQDLF